MNNGCSHLKSILDSYSKKRFAYKETCMLDEALLDTAQKSFCPKTSVLFEQSHTDRVHGKAPIIPKTTNYCILQQMKAVHDIWLPFNSNIMEVIAELEKVLS